MSEQSGDWSKDSKTTVYNVQVGFGESIYSLGIGSFGGVFYPIPICRHMKRRHHRRNTRNTNNGYFKCKAERQQREAEKRKPDSSNGV